MKKIAWEKIEEMAEALSQKIVASDFKPDYIIGVTAGGLIPLYFLAKKLKLTNQILTVSAHSYDKHAQRELVITYLPEIDLTNKKLLLIDEVAETGASLKGISEAVLKKYNPHSVKTATLIVNPQFLNYRPDFYVAEEPDPEIVFPWERDDFPEHFS